MNHQLIFTGELSETLTRLISGQSFSAIVLLADKNTEQHALPLAMELGGSLFTLPPGEDSKSLTTAEKIWQSWLDIGLDRHALLINVGGGMVTDLGGFLASAYKRGIRYINVPTSLLAQVDAAFGGKTGINLGHIKNAVGFFHPPEAVLFDRRLLETLPLRELESGKAEMLKHALIADAGMWEALLQLAPGELPSAELIQRAVAIKAGIVSQDPYETGERKLLNFGHTIGHALESVSLESEHPLLHGEAVVLGMQAETEVAVLAGLLEDAVAASIQAGLRKLFPRLRPVQDFDSWAAYLDNDKKNKDNRILMVLPTGIGEAVTDRPVAREQIREAWQQLQTRWS